jgi:hypothetical protein
MKLKFSQLLNCKLNYNFDEDLIEKKILLTIADIIPGIFKIICSWKNMKLPLVGSFVN